MTSQSSSNRDQTTIEFSSKIFASKLILLAESNPFTNGEYPDDLKNIMLQSSLDIDINLRQFVGFVCQKDKIYACLPKVFGNHLADIDEDTSITLTKTLLETIHQYDRQSNLKNIQSNQPNRMYLSKEIIKDYQQHGLYHQISHDYKKGGNGLINWPRSIKKGQEFWINQMQTPIYTNPIIKQKVKNYDHPLLIAQLAVLNDIQSLYGMISMDLSVHIPPEFNDLISKNQFSQIATKLKKALPNLFQDRAKRLAKFLLNYLELKQKYHEQPYIYGTIAFETIFERMCFDVCQAHPKLFEAQVLGQVLWKFYKPKQSERIGTHQRPDLLVKYKKNPTQFDQCEIIPITTIDDNFNLFILDAKYYDLLETLNIQTSVSHLPSIEDIRKQYAYENWIKVNLSPKTIEIKNGLIFPTNSILTDKTTHPSLEHIGFVSIQRMDMTDDHQHIHIFTISLMTLMSAYLKKEKIDSIKIESYT